MPVHVVTALFDSYEEASGAVDRLERAGLEAGAISLVSSDGAQRARFGDRIGDPLGDAPENMSGLPGSAAAGGPAGHVGLGTGASIGTVLGGGAGLLAGLGLLAVPGLGPVVAAGWLSSTLVGAGVGAAAGGMMGALTDAGLSEADAAGYAEGVRRGGTLVTVRAEREDAERVADILDGAGTVDLDQSQARWRQEGWDDTAWRTDGWGEDAAGGGRAPSLGRDRGGRVRISPGRQG